MLNCFTLRMYLAIALIAVSFIPARAKSFEVLDTVQIDRSRLMNHDGMRAVEIICARQQILGKFYSLALYDLVEASLTTLNDEQRRNVVLICETADGVKTSVALAEVDPDQANVPARLLIGKASETRRGKFELADIEGQEGTIDLSLLALESSNLLRKRITLPDVQLSDNDTQRIRSGRMVIMLPRDNKGERWFDDLVNVFVVMAT